MLDVARHPRHVRQEGGAGQDDGVVADEGGQPEEEGVEVEEEPVPDISAPLEHLECQVPDQAGSVDGDGDVCQREEEQHDVDRRDVVCPDGPVVDFLSTNSLDGKQEEIRYQWRRYEIQVEAQSHERLELAVPIIMLGALLPWRYYLENTENIQGGI